MSRLTQEQIEGIKQFARDEQTDNLNEFLREFKYRRQVRGYEKQPDKPRNPWHIWTAENVVSAMAAAGITETERKNEPEQVEAKMLAWLAGAETADERQRRMIVLLKFCVGMTEVRTADIDLAETIPQPAKPIYGPSKADELGLADITLREVEDALAD